MKQFPAHRPAQIGKASVLILLNRNIEATEILEGIEPESELDWLAFHALCMAKLRMGNIDEAIDGLASGRDKAPWARTRGYFSASLGFAYYKHGKLKEAAVRLSEALQSSDYERKMLS